jgi:hypothetical protein
MIVTVWMQATAVTQATTVAPATSNTKDDSYIMIAHNNARNASNSRNKSYYRTSNTAWMPEIRNAVKAVKIRDGSSSRESSIIMDVIRRTAIIASRKDNNIQQGHQKQ